MRDNTEHGCVRKSYAELGNAAILCLISAALLFFACFGGRQKGEGEQWIILGAGLLCGLAGLRFLLSFLVWRVEYGHKSIALRTSCGTCKAWTCSDLKEILEYYSLPDQRNVLHLYFKDGTRIGMRASDRGFAGFYRFLHQNHCVITKR